MHKQERSYFNVEDALKTPAGRIHTIILVEAYLAMLEPEERLAIFRRYCQLCGMYQHQCSKGLPIYDR